MRDKNTIINRMVDDAAEVMEAKAESDERISQMRVERYGEADETALILRSHAIETRKAVELMRKGSGCWA